jgi:hypothetical protein
VIFEAHEFVADDKVTRLLLLLELLLLGMPEFKSPLEITPASI